MCPVLERQGLLKGQINWPLNPALPPTTHEPMRLNLPVSCCFFFWLRYHWTTILRKFHMSTASFFEWHNTFHARLLWLLRIVYAKSWSSIWYIVHPQQVIAVMMIVMVSLVTLIGLYGFFFFFDIFNRTGNSIQISRFFFSTLNRFNYFLLYLKI